MIGRIVVRDANRVDYTGEEGIRKRHNRTIASNESHRHSNVALRIHSPSRRQTRSSGRKKCGGSQGWALSGMGRQ